MAIFLRLLPPIMLLGAALLLGERVANQPDEVPLICFFSVSDDHADRRIPCPGLVPGRPVISLLPVRLPSSAAACLKADAPSPEAQSLSPPSTA